ARLLIRDLRRLAAEKGVAPDHPEVGAVITYFSNQSKAGRMDYPPMVESKVPIGSGVTEAACKVLVKQRLCGSGMKWKNPGAAAVLSLRCLTYTTERRGSILGEDRPFAVPRGSLKLTSYVGRPLYQFAKPRVGHRVRSPRVHLCCRPSRRAACWTATAACGTPRRSCGCPQPAPRWPWRTRCAASGRSSRPCGASRRRWPWPPGRSARESAPRSP